jgi:type II secretion system protein N
LASASSPPPISRRTLVLGVPAAGILLIALFIYLGFPYAQLGERIAAEVKRREGIALQFQDVGPDLQLAGPGIEATGVRATLPSGAAVRIDELRLRPAWSLAWLRGDPAFHTEVESEQLGSASGTLVLGETPGFTGDLMDVAVQRLPLPPGSPFGAIDGLVNARLDVALGPDGAPQGEAQVDAREGSLQLPGFALAIPFATLSGELAFGGDAWVAVNRLDLEGPMASAKVTGNVLPAASFAQAPLRLEAEIVAKTALQNAMRQAGVRFDRSGAAKLRVTGTVAVPNIR